MPVPSLFRRYRPLVDDWEAFAAALERPLPRCLWVHPERLEAGEMEDRLRSAGMEAEPIGWLAGAWRLPAESRPGNLLEFCVGLCHVQEEAALSAVELLAPRPGERVLDLCAAPGNKTLRIALAVGREGTVVANDLSSQRLAPTLSHLHRLGLAHVAVATWDAASLPRAAGLYDRVLADVPCTCEGTVRKSPEVLEHAGRQSAERMASLQRAILRKALQHCRPGGRVVYSTCTWAPEENEAVVDAVLREEPAGSVEIAPARLPGFAASPGLEAWGGRRFVAGMERAMRVWPHQNDTGGFFVAVLDRAPDAPLGVEPDAPVDRPEPADAAAVLAGLADRFALSAADLDGLVPVRAKRRRLHLVPAALAAPARPVAVSTGLPFVHLDARPPKLSTAAALALGPAIRTNAVEIDRARAADYVRRRRIALGEGEAGGVDGPGHVLLRHRGHPLGLGLLRRGADGWEVVSQFPKRWAPSSPPPGAAGRSRPG